jgi:hypothetical protein
VFGHVMSAVDMSRIGDKPEKREEPRLTKRALGNLTAVVSEIRAAVNGLGPLGAPVLDVLDATEAVPAVRDLYYALNAEDPDDVMPTRKLIGDWELARSCVIPILRALHADPVAANDKRWASSLYHIFRLLYILSKPVESSNQALRPGCTLEVHLMDLKQIFATDKTALRPLVALLQFYLERKAEKMASLAAAEDSRLEDARVDNILCFFRNLLTPARNTVDKELTARDRGTHLSLVGAMARADLFATLSVLFSSREDATAQYTNIVYVAAEIHALAFRLSTPRELAKSFIRNSKHDQVDKRSESEEEEECDAPNVDCEPIDSTVPSSRISSNHRPCSGLRAALLRERSSLGGSRSVLKSARWTNRYSGEFLTTSNKTSLVGNKRTSNSMHNPGDRITSICNITPSPREGPDSMCQSALQANSEILGLIGASSRPKIMISNRKSTLCYAVRADLQELGLIELGKLANSLIQDYFIHLISELRERISDYRLRSNVEEIWKGRCHFLLLVGVVVGYQREISALRSISRPNAHRLEISIGHVRMDKALMLNRDLVLDWKAVEIAIDVESFKLVFDALIEAREEKDRVVELEMASSALKEMLNFLQGMALGNQTSPELTPREVALNTLEDVFQNEGYLEAPSMLARDFDPKIHSFRHLANAIEIAFTFTSTLMDSELEHITVVRHRKRRQKTKAKHMEAISDDGAEVQEDISMVKHPQQSAPSADHGELNEIILDAEHDVVINGPGVESHGALTGDIVHDVPQTAKLSQIRNNSFGDEVSDDVALLFNVSYSSSEGASFQDEILQQRDEVNAEIIDTCDDIDGGQASGLEVQGDPLSSEHQLDVPLTEDENFEKSVRAPNESISVVAALVDSDNDEDGEYKVEPQSAGDVEMGEQGPGNQDLSEEAACEVEACDIIRRFARPKALQNLMLALRVAICTEAFLPVPEGSRELLSLSLVARSVAILKSVWTVAGSRERGAFRCAFFNLATLQLFGLAILLANTGKCSQSSILEHFANLGREVSFEFYEMLAVNPTLLVDSLFFSEISTQRLYASKKHKKEWMESEQ